MKKTIAFLTTLCLCAGLTACGGAASSSEEPAATVPETEAVTEAETEPETEAPTEAAAEETQPETVPYIEVVEEGMVPVTADTLNDGEYPVTVSSSSSMFNIEHCTLTVKDGVMTAEMTMGGSGYAYLYMGTGEEADKADKSSWIPAEEKDGVCVFTVPVEALDKGIACAAYSKRKELWYDRTILFRADSLPTTAFGIVNDPKAFGIEDGEYTTAVALSGGSGKASVQSPAKITVKDGKVTAEIIWSSNKYDYMIVDGERYEPVSVEEHSVFEIPVVWFDRPIAVSADTTAMSEPHLIDYTLCFDSAVVKQ